MKAGVARHRVELVADDGATPIEQRRCTIVPVLPGHPSQGDEGNVGRVGYIPLNQTAPDEWTAELVSELGFLVCEVAGTSYRLQALQDDAFSVLSPVIVRPDPTNSHDGNALGIWDRTGTIQVGFVPRTMSASVASWFHAEGPLGAAVLAELRDGPLAGRRVRLLIVVAPVGDLELEVAADEEPTSTRLDPRSHPANRYGQVARSNRAIPAVAEIGVRITALRRVWMEIDELNAACELRAERPARTSWAHRELMSYPVYADRELRPLLSPEARRDVEELWGTETVSGHISRIVRADRPMGNLLGALVPALNVWDVLLDEAWRTCRRHPGPGGVVPLWKYQPWLTTLDDIGAPIDPDVVSGILARQEELRCRMPPARPLWFPTPPADANSEPTITFPEEVVAEEERLFVQMRDLITERRRAWAKVSLDRYLEGAWQLRVETLAAEYEARLAKTGSRRATLTHVRAIDFVNEWLGGRTEPLYTLIGHPRPVVQRRREIPTVDVDELIDELRVTLDLPRPELDEEDPFYEPPSPFSRWIPGQTTSPDPIDLTIGKRIGELRRAVELESDPVGHRIAFPTPDSEDGLSQIGRALDLTPRQAWLHLTGVILEWLPEAIEVSYGRRSPTGGR